MYSGFNTLLIALKGGVLNTSTRIKNAPDELVRIFTEIATISANDAVSFDTEKMTVERIKEDADYHGLEIWLNVCFERSRYVFQFKIGFDDVLVPRPVDITYLTILDMEMPHLRAYSLESVITEKLQAIIYLADLNSRVKDSYDIYELSRSRYIDGTSIAEAMTQTFNNRNTEFFSNLLVFIVDFHFLSDKQVLWQAFQLRTRIINVVIDSSVIVSAINRFFLPVYEALIKKETFDGRWNIATKIWYRDGR